MNEQQPTWREIFADLGRGLSHATSRTRTIGEQLNALFSKLAEEYRPALEQLGQIASQFRAAYDEGVPENWQQLTTPQIFEVISLMERTGWCLTATPPSETLVALIQAPDDGERGSVLLANEARIIEDLDLELRSIDSKYLPLVAAASREALEAHKSGLFLASQALSSNALATLLERQGPLGMKSLGQGRERLGQLDIEEAGLREIRFYAVAGAVARSFATFSPLGPSPLFFNRHASAHAINAQYSQLNSLTAMSLLIGFLRELTWLLEATNKGGQD